MSEGAGTLREMEQRAAAIGFKISRTTLGDYSNGKIKRYPNEQTRRALAAALEVELSVVDAAALTTAAPSLTASQQTVDEERAEAFLELTADRTPQEIRQILGVVRAMVAGMKGDTELDGAD